MSELKEGTRVRVLDMQDKDPVPAGTEGTVKWVVKVADSNVIAVRWDNGRTLNLVVPPDTYEVIPCLKVG
ncbi:MAG: DUF4314 domain-containing protein [Veillonellaceae bacterium]|nr:DUF4314 domain-containing protein [Veillonellaceae bacterium]